MLNIWKSDLFRACSDGLFCGIIAVTGIAALSLVFMINRDIHLGISIFGSLTEFKNIDDVLRVGLEYQKGPGVLAAVFISVFISREYQWKTWQHKLLEGGSRADIYLSKAMLSSAVSVFVFMLFETAALFCSGRIWEAGGYADMLVCGVFIYAALGAVLCLIAMLVKSNAAAVIACLLYVLFNETFASVIENLSSFAAAAAAVVRWCLDHSVYGMALAAVSKAPSGVPVGIALNSMVIILMSAAAGLCVFRKYEL